MKTKKFYAVVVSDDTCNVPGRESGIYGRGDYSWINESLNGGDGDYNMTEAEALEVKADFERLIKERNLKWASVDIDSVEIPYADTLQDVADYYNETDVLGPELDAMIEKNGWVNDCDTEIGICHSETEKVIVNDNGKAVVVPMMKDTITLYLVSMYEAYMAAETGINAVRNIPTDTIHYKHEVLEEAEVKLPAGFTIEKTHGEGEEIFRGNEAADMITEYTDDKYVTSLVTSDGIVTLKVWNYGRN